MPIPTIINSKLAFTNGIVPKKKPLRVVNMTHVIPPAMLYFVKVFVCIWLIPAVNGMTVRIMGMKRPKKTAAFPWWVKKVYAFLSLCGLRSLDNNREAVILLLKCLPSLKLMKSPTVAAIDKMTISWTILSEWLRAASDPHKNKTESPGRNGVMTKPVSENINKKSSPYIQGPKLAMSDGMRSA